VEITDVEEEAVEATLDCELKGVVTPHLTTMVATESNSPERSKQH
jgi:hypothetical protein